MEVDDKDEFDTVRKDDEDETEDDDDDDSDVKGVGDEADDTL